jgi:hypothetical protein
MRRTNGMLIPRRYTLARKITLDVQTRRRELCQASIEGSPVFFARLDSSSHCFGGTIEKADCRFANKVRHR